MRVVVAGASGAVGARLIPQLLAANHEVIGLTRRAGTVVGTDAGSRVREIVTDVSDRTAFLAAIDGVRADAVVHQLTALAKPPRTHRDMRETNRLRAEGTSTLLAAARAVGAGHFVAASFFGGYGFRDHGGLPRAEDAPFGEEDGRNDAVLTALLSLELQVRAFGGISLRYGLFYGAEPRSVSPVARRWSGLLPMVHLEDAASAVVRALEAGAPGAVYNIADEEPVSYRARQGAIAARFGLKSPMLLPDSLLRSVAPFASQLLTSTAIELDTGRARDELGWKPRHPSITAWAAERVSSEERASSAEDAAHASSAERFAAAERAAATRETPGPASEDAGKLAS